MQESHKPLPNSTLYATQVCGTGISARGGTLELNKRILELTKLAVPGAVLTRRDFHQYPEVGWTEFRTASKVARRLADLGLEVKVGRAVMTVQDRFGMPSEAELERHFERAIADGADKTYLQEFRGGFPAVVATLTGSRPGPIIALRVDIDALPIRESDSSEHYPAQAGFASRYPGVMHSCGHDGHTAIGLAVAEVLSAVRHELAGTVHLIFQPGEEGCRGALPMMKAGVVDGVDYFYSIHLGMGAPSGSICPTVQGYLASTKFDVRFRGRSSHAGAKPEDGRNALLAAAQATLALHALPRHSEGPTRVNVGYLQGGSGRNIIAEGAYMMVETRGSTSAIDRFMDERANEVLHGIAAAYGVEVEITRVGGAVEATNDPELDAVVRKSALSVPGLNVIDAPLQMTGSDDATYFMRRVQEQGGLASYFGIGSDLPTGHHTPTFDIQERDFAGGIATVAIAVAATGLHLPPRMR